MPSTPSSDTGAVDVDDYGADPTGEAASDEALREAVDDADPHGRVLLTNGSYRLEEHNRLEKAVTVVAEGSTVECTRYNGDKETFRQDELHGTHEAAIWFAGEQAETGALDAPAGRHADRIEVEDPSPFSVGDDLTLAEADVRQYSRAYRPTRTTVRNVEGSTLYLTTPLKYDYDAGDEVHRLDALVGPRVVGGTWTGEADNVVTMNYTRDAEVRDVHVESYRRHPFQTVDGLRTAFVDCSAGPALNLHGSHGETFRIAGSSDVYVVRPYIRRCRRAVDLTSGCKTLYVAQPMITAVTLIGFSYHSNQEVSVNGNMEVYGGYCAASVEDDTLRPWEADLPVEVQLGAPAGTTAGDGHTRFYGVHMIGKERVVTGGGDDVLFEGCTLETAEGGDGVHVLNLEGEEMVARDVAVRAPRGAETGVRVTGSDVAVEGTVRGSFSRSGVAVEDEAEAVSLAVDVRGERADETGAGEGDGLAIGDCADVRVRDGRVAASGSALRFDGDAEGVSVTGCTFAADAADGRAVATDPDAVLEDVWFVGNDCTRGGSADVDLAGDVTGLWVKDNRLGGVSTSEDASDVFERDNRVGQ